MNREAHVKRIYSEDKAAWVDVLRLDRIYVSNNGQGMWLNIAWDDTAEEETLQQGRTYKELILEAPEGVTGSQIKLNVITSLILSNNGQKCTWNFDNESDNAKRTVTPRRVSFRDDGATFDGYSSWSGYKDFFADFDQDTSQYIDTEIINTLTISNNGQRTIVTLHNDEAEDFIGTAQPQSGGTVYRLDPFQVIVNVSWGGLVDIMHLVDCSGSFASFNDASVRQHAEAIYEEYPAARQGYGTFVDYPFDPYGEPGDWVYRLQAPLKEKAKQSYVGWNGTDASGADMPEAQLDAYYRCANDNGVGWTYNKPQIIIIYTDTSPHDGEGPHITKSLCVSTLRARKIYPVYAGFDYSLGFGSTISHQNATDAEILAVVKTGIAYCTTYFLGNT